jgi:hypothetical protein
VNRKPEKVERCAVPVQLESLAAAYCRQVCLFHVLPRTQTHDLKFNLQSPPAANWRLNLRRDVFGSCFFSPVLETS